MMILTDVETTKETHTEAPPPKVSTKNGGEKKGAVKKSAKKGTSAKPIPKTKSAQAQGGPVMDLPIAEMNKDELKIVKHAYSKSGERKPYSIKDFKKVLGGTGTSRVRNALRRPIRAGWLEKVERGVHRITEKARKRGIGSQGN